MSIKAEFEKEQHLIGVELWNMEMALSYWKEYSMWLENKLTYTYSKTEVDKNINKLEKIEVIVVTDKKGNGYELADAKELKKIINSLKELGNKEVKG